ncbi:MAG: hypothetical protein RIB59_04350 [Rhodospirillales bacterium]
MALLIAGAAFIVPVRSHGNADLCAERRVIVSILGSHYQEHLHFLGVQANGLKVELFVSNNASFTVLLYHPSGMSCIIAAGEYWQALGNGKRSNRI